MNRKLKKRVAKITAGSLLVSNIATVSVGARTLTLGQLYKKAYDASIKAKETAEKNGVKGFFTTGKGCLVDKNKNGIYETTESIASTSINVNVH